MTKKLQLLKTFLAYKKYFFILLIFICPLTILYYKEIYEIPEYNLTSEEMSKNIFVIKTGTFIKTYLLKIYGDSLSNIYTDSIIQCVLKYSSIYNVDPLLVLSIIYQESNFNPKAIGKHNDFGLMQITKYALNEFNKSNREIFIVKMGDLYNIDLNIHIGVWYIKEQLNQHKNIEKSLAFYNAGKYWQEIGLEYASQVKQKYKILKKL